MTLISSMALAILGGLFVALAACAGIRAAWRNCEGRRGVFAALAILAAVCSIVAQKPSPDTPTITVDALLRDVGCYATNNVFHAAVTNAPSYAGVDFSDCDLMVYARERASTNAASWFELTPRKKFSQQPADYAIENATNFNYMVYLNYVPPSPVHTNGVFELYGFVIENEAQGEPDQLAAGFINSRAVPLPFDAEVEYLEGTGTQYIDTGVVWNRALTVSATVVGLQSTTFALQAFFGARNLNAANAGYTFGFNSSNRFVSDNSGSRAISSMIYAQGAVYTIVKNLSGCSITNAAGTTENLINNAGTQTATYNLLLFALNNVGAPSTAKCRFYGCKIWDANGVLIRDFIPVRVGTTGAMYDKRGVGGKNGDGSPRNDGMYFNRGTGNFGYGNDK